MRYAQEAMLDQTFLVSGRNSFGKSQNENGEVKLSGRNRETLSLKYRYFHIYTILTIIFPCRLINPRCRRERCDPTRRF